MGCPCLLLFLFPTAASGADICWQKTTTNVNRRPEATSESSPTPQRGSINLKLLAVQVRTGLKFLFVVSYLLLYLSLSMIHLFLILQAHNSGWFHLHTFSYCFHVTCSFKSKLSMLHHSKHSPLPEGPEPLLNLTTAFRYSHWKEIQIGCVYFERMYSTTSIATILLLNKLK